MIQNMCNNFQFVRRIKGGEWYDTRHKGWITAEMYKSYLSKGFDTGLISWETFKNFLQVN